MSRLMDTKKMLMSCLHFYHFIVSLTFKLPINRIVKIFTSNWIVQSLRRYVYVSFITMWYNDPRFSTILIVLITRDEKFFILQQRIGEMIQIICHIFLFVICTNVLSGNKSRSSVLVPVGPYNSAFLQLPFFFILRRVS